MQDHKIIIDTCNYHTSLIGHHRTSFVFLCLDISHNKQRKFLTSQENPYITMYMYHYFIIIMTIFLHLYQVRSWNKY